MAIIQEDENSHTRRRRVVESFDYCLQMHLIGDLPVIECKYWGLIGQQPCVLVFSISGYGIEQDCIHSLIVVEKVN
jgi:hypothetical protein